MIEPFYQDDFVTIYNADCRDVLLHLEQVDLTVTSPPYDNLRDYKGYDFDFETTAKQLFRVTKTGSVVVWVVGDQTINGSETGTSFRQALFFKEIGFNLHDTMIYEKANGCFGSRNAYFQSFEYMFVFSKGKIQPPNLLIDHKTSRSGAERAAAGGRDMNGSKSSRTSVVLNEYAKRKNIWRYAVGLGGTTRDVVAFNHPAIFPEALARDHILSWANAGDTILDPFMGSGTTLKMAKKLGCKAIGIEISKEYCEIAVTRLGQNSFQFAA